MEVTILNSLASMDFTVAVASDSMTIEQDMTFIKAALLYSDTITLVSPVASTYLQLTNESNNKNEKTLFSLVNKVIPFCQMADPILCDTMSQTLEQFGTILNSKQYNSIPVSIKYPIKKTLLEFSNNIKEVLEQNLGKNNCSDLEKLVRTKKVRLHNFQSSFANDDAYVYEFYNILKRSVSNMQTFPLFDDLSNSLIKSAIKDNVITLNTTNKFEAKHAKLTSNLLIALPSFEFATIDEILDIRKALEKPLIRFRSKLLSYDSEIQSMPWDEDFQHECMKLYQREVAPAVLEIDELTQESTFIKNLGYSLLTDESALRNAGELVITIAMAGVISAFSDVLSSGQALLTTGGAYTASKVASAFKEYRETQTEITKKDMYFYYRAGKLLEKNAK